MPLYLISKPYEKQSQSLTGEKLHFDTVLLSNQKRAGHTMFKDFNYPTDNILLKEFLQETLTEDSPRACLNISGLQVFITPEDTQNGAVWYTDPHGKDNMISISGSQDEICLETFYANIIRLAKFWDAPRNEHGELLKLG